MGAVAITSRGLPAPGCVEAVTMPILWALAILAVVAILSPRTFFAIVITTVAIYLIAPPEWKRPDGWPNSKPRGEE